MEKIMERMGLYDIFARGLTGTTVILAADVFGIAGLWGASENSDTVPGWAVLVAGYFCGLVLEELSYIMEKLFHSRKRNEAKVCDAPKYADYLYEECKAALLAEDRDDICDEPLAHIVMSASFEIAFTFFLFLELVNAFFRCGIISGSFISPVADIFILAALIIIFHFREGHYSRRRAERIFDYCIAKCYPGIRKSEDEIQGK